MQDTIKNDNKLKILVSEFMRYVVVGGVAFIADFAVLYAAREYVFNSVSSGLYLATACGFIFGLAVNYALSLLFVFTQAKDQGKGRDLKSFMIFTVIGLIGLLLTELGMYLGTEQLHLHYLLVKCIVTGLVLVWNYGGRKLIIFN